MSAVGFADLGGCCFVDFYNAVLLILLTAGLLCSGLTSI